MWFRIDYKIFVQHNSYRHFMHVKENAKKMQTSKDPRDTSLLDVTYNYLSFILKVLRLTDENSAEPRSIDRSCSASVLRVFSVGKIEKKNIFTFTIGTR